MTRFTENSTAIGPRKSLWLAILAICLCLYWVPLRALAILSRANESYSYIPVVPLLAAWLVWLRRKNLKASGTDFKAARWWFAAGIAIYAAALLMPGGEYRLSVWIASLVIVLIGAVTLVTGPEFVRQLKFPLGYLFFAIPIPEPVLQKIVQVLQHGSAELTYLIFQATGIPVFREGLVFTLPGLSIEVAPECSGIRSTISLLLITVILANLFLRSTSHRTILILASLPIAILKNGLRIVALSLLSIYVDPRFMTGALHRDGGILFFMIGLGGVFLALKLLQKREGRTLAVWDHAKTAAAAH